MDELTDVCVPEKYLLNYHLPLKMRQKHIETQIRGKDLEPPHRKWKTVVVQSPLRMPINMLQ